jgi:hypothetical protein
MEHFSLTMGLCLLALGFVAGAVAERIRVYRRHLAILRRQEAMLSRWHAHAAAHAGRHTPGDTPVGENDLERG